MFPPSSCESHSFCGLCNVLKQIDYWNVEILKYAHIPCMGAAQREAGSDHSSTPELCGKYDAQHLHS